MTPDNIGKFLDLFDNQETLEGFHDLIDLGLFASLVWRAFQHHANRHIEESIANNIAIDPKKPNVSKPMREAILRDALQPFPEDKRQLLTQTLERLLDAGVAKQITQLTSEIVHEHYHHEIEMRKIQQMRNTVKSASMN